MAVVERVDWQWFRGERWRAGVGWCGAACAGPRGGFADAARRGSGPRARAFDGLRRFSDAAREGSEQRARSGNVHLRSSEQRARST